MTELNRTGFLHPHDERLLGKKMEETEMQDEKPGVNFNLKCILKCNCQNLMKLMSISMHFITHIDAKHRKSSKYVNTVAA